MGKERTRQVRDRFSANAVGATEVERLCAYLKNDSMVRWHSGCTQAAVDAARRRLAKRRSFVAEPYLPSCRGNFETKEEAQRLQRAQNGNRAYLRAIAKVGTRA